MIDLEGDKMKIIKFTDDEIKILRDYLFGCNICLSDCILQDMRESTKDCKECHVTKIIESIEDKIGRE
jgi:hypothetical protein